MYNNFAGESEGDDVYAADSDGIISIESSLINNPNGVQSIHADKVNLTLKDVTI